MLIYPQARHMPSRVRVFIDFLLAPGAQPSG
nr:LysR family transcriptional regulator [Pseudomonas plecoglossicida NB2011]